MDNFRIRNFEGPLDLLVSLVYEKKKDIFEISILEVIQQFLLFLANIQEPEKLNNLSSFYLMASHLMFIKSKMLLPPSEEENEDEQGWQELSLELIEKIIEYKKYQVLALKLLDKMDTNIWEISYKEELLKELKNEYQKEENLSFDKDILKKLLKDVQKKLNSIKVTDLNEKVSILEKRELLLKLCKEKKSFFLSDLIVKNEKMHIICSFLAILESAKQGEIFLSQESPYQEIKIVSKLFISTNKE